MKRNLFDLILIICLFITSCSGGNEQSTQGEEVISLAKESFNLTEDFFSQISLVPLQTTEQALIRDIDAVSMAGDTLFLLDRGQLKVFIYLVNGKFVNAIQDIGNGPKEYSSISDITVHNGSLAVLCDVPYKIMYYTYDGKFVKEQSLTDYWECFASIGKRFCLYRSGRLGERTINIFDELGGIETILPQPNGRFVAREAKSVGTIITYGSGKLLTHTHDVFFTWPFDYTIYTIKNGKPHPCYTIDFGAQTLPDELLKEEISNNEFLRICDKKKYIYNIADIVANEDYLFFKTNPWLFILDRKERNLMSCGMLKNGLGLYNFRYLPVNGSEKLVQIYSVSLFKSQLESVIQQDKLPKTQLGKAAARIFNEIEDEDNPVLVFYQLPKKGENEIVPLN